MELTRQAPSLNTEFRQPLTAGRTDAAQRNDIGSGNVGQCSHLFARDLLCGLVVRVPGYRSGGPGFDSRALQEKK
jgi:hypothetical protein